MCVALYTNAFQELISAKHKVFSTTMVEFLPETICH